MIVLAMVQEAKESIQILANIAKDCGLSINKNKGNIIIFNSKNQPDYIEDIPITTSITYLALTIHNKMSATNYRELKQQKVQKSTQA